MTQLYDDALRASGVRVTQFTLLQFLDASGRPMTQGTLGELLAVDSTTLSRSLKPLEHAKWIRRLPGKDGRERYIALTPSGRRVLKRSIPAWERVQRRVRAGLGPRDWAALHELLTSAVRTVRQL